MQELVKRLEEHEEERIDHLRAAADKIIVYETNQELNNWYDAKQFASVVESICADKQMTFFKSKVNLMKLERVPDFQFVKVAVYDPNPTPVIVQRCMSTP